MIGPGSDGRQAPAAWDNSCTLDLRTCPSKSHGSPLVVAPRSGLALYAPVKLDGKMSVGEGHNGAVISGRGVGFPLDSTKTAHIRNAVTLRSASQKD